MNAPEINSGALLLYEQKKKIALLNMRYDNNYGGNLQRYAMVTILQRLGYDVEYLYSRDNWDDWFANRTKGKIIKQSVKQIVRHLLHPTQEPWLAWKREREDYRKTCKITEPFLEKYIPHTQPIYSHRDLEQVFLRGKYDIVMAGSDQIWCKHHIKRYGLGMWYFDFVPENYKGKRVIYGASFGVDDVEYTEQELQTIRPLYNKINAVSVREYSGLQLLQDYQLIVPNASHVADPVLMIGISEWLKVINAANTMPFQADIMCYMLYLDKEKQNAINSIAEKNGYNYQCLDLSATNNISVEQWLRNIYEAKYVITDSYHGFLFSLLFNKPYTVLLKGKNGGTTRFDSIFNMLGVGTDSTQVNWEEVNSRIENERRKSLDFIKQAML